MADGIRKTAGRNGGKAGGGDNDGVKKKVGPDATQGTGAQGTPVSGAPPTDTESPAPAGYDPNIKLPDKPGTGVQSQLAARSTPVAEERTVKVGPELHPLAGTLPPRSTLIDVPKLISDYYRLRPDPSIREQRVAFGTSGHRGSAFNTAFNEAHVLAVAQGMIDYRTRAGITGPMFLGYDSHALSRPAFITLVEVLAAQGVHVMIDAHQGLTPTPVISHAILAYNRGRKSGFADGGNGTPSHNPPEDGGIKYSPPNGGPADTSITAEIEKRANELLAAPDKIKRIPFERALKSGNVTFFDFIGPYVEDLRNVLNLSVLQKGGLKIGADPLGGSNLAYWPRIAERYQLDITVVNDDLDPRFGFMPCDWDGKIRMDCSSPHAMAGLIGLKDKFDIAFGNDCDSDRHGIVTRSGGLMNPNHFLAAAINYLLTKRAYGPEVEVGKTMVSSSMIDRVAAAKGRKVFDEPVGFKWFVDGLLSGRLAFAGEESAGASFLRKNGQPWSTDKDGIILALLAAEMTAANQKDPSESYRELTRKFGEPAYERIDAPATPDEKDKLKKLSPERVTSSQLAGEPILQILTQSPGSGAPFGGIKVVTQNGWFAARPSGTENVYKIYAESFLGKDHLRRIQEEAKAIVQRALES